MVRESSHAYDSPCNPGPFPGFPSLWLEGGGGESPRQQFPQPEWYLWLSTQKLRKTLRSLLACFYVLPHEHVCTDNLLCIPWVPCFYSSHPPSTHRSWGMEIPSTVGWRRNWQNGSVAWTVTEMWGQCGERVKRGGSEFDIICEDCQIHEYSVTWNPSFCRNENSEKSAWNSCKNTLWCAATSRVFGLHVTAQNSVAFSILLPIPSKFLKKRMSDSPIPILPGLKGMTNALTTRWK